MTLRECRRKALDPRSIKTRRLKIISSCLNIKHTLNNRYLVINYKSTYIINRVEMLVDFFRLIMVLRISVTNYWQTKSISIGICSLYISNYDNLSR